MRIHNETTSSTARHAICLRAQRLPPRCAQAVTESCQRIKNHGQNSGWSTRLAAQVMWDAALTKRTGGPFGLATTYLHPERIPTTVEDSSPHAALLLLSVISAFAVHDDPRWQSSHATACVALAPLASRQWWAYPDVGNAPTTVYSTQHTVGRFLSVLTGGSIERAVVSTASTGDPAATVASLTFPLEVPIGFDAPIQGGSVPWYIARAELLTDAQTMRWSTARAPYGEQWIRAAEATLQPQRAELLDEQARCLLTALASQLSTALGQDVTQMPTT